jgi:hypothetical protein
MCCCSTPDGARTPVIAGFLAHSPGRGSVGGNARKAAGGFGRGGAKVVVAAGPGEPAAKAHQRPLGVTGRGMRDSRRPRRAGSTAGLPGALAGHAVAVAPWAALPSSGALDSVRRQSSGEGTSQSRDTGVLVVEEPSALDGEGPTRWRERADRGQGSGKCYAVLLLSCPTSAIEPMRWIPRI